MAVSIKCLDSSMGFFAKATDYKNIGLSENGMAYILDDTDSLSSDMPNVAAIFSLVLSEFETKKADYVEVCENFYERSGDFASVKSSLELHKRRLDFIVKIIQGRETIFENMYSEEEVYTRYSTYLEEDHHKSIADFYPLEKALQKQVEQRLGFEARMKEMEQAPQRKRLSILVHTNSSSSLPSPTSSVAMISNPLESISDTITFVTGDCTQYDGEFGINGKTACGAIAFEALSKLFKNPGIEQINETWLRDTITNGVKVYDRVVGAMRSAALGMGISAESVFRNPTIDVSTIGNSFPDFSIAKLGFQDNATKGVHHYVGKATLHQGLLQLEDIAKAQKEHSCGAVIVCNGKSYALKIDYKEPPNSSVATVIDSHGYPFDEFAKASYLCRFPDLNATSDYLQYLLRPHDDGSQRNTQFSIISVIRK